MISFGLGFVVGLVVGIFSNQILGIIKKYVKKGKQELEDVSK